MLSRSFYSAKEKRKPSLMFSLGEMDGEARQSRTSTDSSFRYENMKDITFKSNFGRFEYEITATIDPEVFRTLPFVDGGSTDAEKATAVSEARMQAQFTNLAMRGLADTGFRGVSSDVEKALVDAKLMTKEQKRAEVVFAKETAVLIAEKAQTKLDEIAKKQNLPAMFFRVTGEHVFGEAGDKPTKEATDAWTKLQALPEEQFKVVLKGLGLGEDYTDETAILAVKKQLAVRKARIAAEMQKDLLGSLTE